MADTEIEKSTHRRQEAAPGTSLYVGNLPFSVRWQELKELFSDAGTVVFADIPREYETQRSRGFGLVRFETAEEAHKALEMFNGFDLNGRTLNVREDQKREQRVQREPREQREYVPREQREDRHGGPRAPREERAPREPRVRTEADTAPTTSEKLFIGNLAWGVNWQDLKDVAKENGLNPVRCDVAIGDNQRSRGFGTMSFGSVEEAVTAQTVLQGMEIKGRAIEVREDRKR